MDGPAAPGSGPVRSVSTPLRDLNSLVPDRRRRAEASDPRRRADDELIVLSWNVFHGRDWPPEQALRRKRRVRSLMFRATVHDATHVHVNRSLFEEFAGVIASSSWDVCLLQECPPRWADGLADECLASAFVALTSRNWLAPVRNVIAKRNPDIMGSWEGGSNLTLVRPPWRIVEGASVLLNPLRERRLRERRRLALTRLVHGEREVSVGNLHLSAGVPDQAAREARRAAEVALDWAHGAPVVLGGDFNVQPGSTVVFDDLCDGASLCGRTADGIDHILACGIDSIDPAAPWAPERRELDVLTGLERRRLRLSDHAPVEARFSLR
ncbi:MAG: endonuclease/exonuclease/phosphatase family protein [Solirubrobacterales bacterium]